VAIDFRSIGQVQVWSAAPASSFVCPKPAGLAAGDLMVATVLTNGVGVTLPAGWTDLYYLTAAGNPNQRVFYRIADSSDVAAASFTFATATATYGSAEVCAYTDVNTTNPIDFTCVPVDSAASLTAFTIPAATVVTEGAVLIGGAGANTGVTTQVWSQPTSPGQWVDEWNPATGAGGATSASGGKSHVRGHYLTPLAAGSSTGAVTFTLSVSRAGDAWFAGLRPSGGGGAVTPALLTRVVGVGGTPTTGRVMVRVQNATSAQLRVGTDQAVTQNVVTGPAVTPDASGNAHLTVSGLTPGTKYYYRVVMTDTDGGSHTDTQSQVGSLRTAPVGAASFNIDFASCTNAADSNAMLAVAGRDDDLFLHLGDFYYADGSGTDLANFRSKMLAKVSAANHQAVFATRPLVYIPSDHDGMNNNSTAGTDPTAWTNWNAAYREYIPTPALPATGCYYTFTWGRVRFVVTDTQSFKMDPSTTESASKTSLGATQKQWIKDTIDAATEPVIIVVNAQPWIGSPIAGDDSWLGFTTERAEMAAYFSGTGKNIVLTGGDQHCLAADDGSNSPGGVPIFHAAPLNNTASRKGGPYSAGQYPASGSSQVQQYGHMAVTDDGSQISLAYTGYDSDNVAHITLTKTYSTQAPPPPAPQMPLGDLPGDSLSPAGWTQLLAEDFDTDCAQGAFPATYPSWTPYPDTWDNGHTSYYNGGNSISVADGVLTMRLFTDGTGKPRTETIQPPSAQGGQQQYGIYEIAYRVPAPIPGYKQAFLLWPVSNDGNQGEIDFPEASFDAGQPIAGFVHEVEPPGVHENNAYSEDSGVDATAGEWHVCRTVWKDDTVEFWLDGTRLGTGYTSTVNVPDIPMTWKLQTEGNLTGTFADPGIDPATTGTLELAYAVAYAPAGATPTVGTASGNLDFVGTAVGSVDMRGSGTGTLALHGTAIGAGATTGTASGTLALHGTAVGSLAMRGRADGTLTLTGEAQGLIHPVGTAHGTLHIVGLAISGQRAPWPTDGTLRPATAPLTIERVAPMICNQAEVIKQGDLRPLSWNVNADLSGASVVVAFAASPGGDEMITLPGVVSGTTGQPSIVTFTTSAELTANPTTWYFVMRATLGATVMTLPSQGYTKLQVEATID
jgi:alkaline phosphatase D